MEQQASTSYQAMVAGGLSTKSQPLGSHSASLSQENLSHPRFSQQLLNSSACTVSNTLAASLCRGYTNHMIAILTRLRTHLLPDAGCIH